MKRTLLTITFSYLFIAVLYSQRSYLITQIDFDPDSSALAGFWPNIPIADSFLTAEPIFKKIPEHATRVQMCYTSKGLWINALCYSNKIRNDGTFRDIIADADYFSIGLDTWNDDQNAFVFGVTARGQVFDRRINGDETVVAYNTPWKAQTRITAEGWQVVMFIPFTAVRFPKGAQDWGVQFTRFDRGSGELSTWNPQNPMINDLVWQYGQLDGLEGITAREKANMFIYGNTSAERSKWEDSDRVNTSRNRYIFGGIDGQVGLNTATTLNFTVLPENGFENGTSYNTYYNFLLDFSNELPTINGFRPLRNDEYTLFNRNNLGSSNELIGFYTNQYFISHYGDFGFVFFKGINNQRGGEVLNALKISTQTKNNWRIGVRNTSYLPANYSVTVFDSVGTREQRIRPSILPTSHTISAQKIFRKNTYIYLSTTNFLPGRKVGYNAINIAGQWRDKSNNFEIKGFIYNQTVYLHSDTSYFSNINQFLSIGKVNGKWKFGADYTALKADKTNELWKLPLDKKTIELIQFYTNYTFFPKSRYFIRHNIGARAFQNRSNKRPMFYSINWNGTDKHYKSYQVGLASDLKPSISFLDLGYTALSKALKPYIYTNAQFSTDQRKRYVMTTNVNALGSIGSELWSFSLFQRMRYVMNKYWSINLSSSIYYNNNRITSAKTVDGLSYFATQKPLHFRFGQKQVFALSKKWLVTTGLVISPKIQWLEDNNYTINPNSTITPTPLDYFPVANGTSFHLFLGIDYCLSNGSLFRFDYQNKTDRNTIYNPDLIQTHENNNIVNLQFIWNIHPSERQRR